MLIQLFKERPHGIEFYAKTAPIPGFQPLHSAVVVAEGLACSKVIRGHLLVVPIETRFCMSRRSISARKQANCQSSSM
jgi:hypothetical protein